MVVDIQSSSMLSLETVIKLFDLKIVPILKYGLTIIWEHPGKKQANTVIRYKAVPLDAMEALGGRGGIAPTHSRPRH
jgi:hypothetical protein